MCMTNGYFELTEKPYKLNYNLGSLVVLENSVRLNTDKPGC